MRISIVYTVALIAVLTALPSTLDRDPTRRMLADAVVGQARALLDLPPVTRTLTGRRLLGVSRQTVKRVITLAMAYHLEGDTRYAQRAEKEMLAAASPAEPSLEGLDEDGLAVLMYTGGTTGLPKGVMLSHRNLLAAVQAIAGIGMQTTGARTLYALPLFHIANWQAFLFHAVGGCVIVSRRARSTWGLRW